MIVESCQILCSVFYNNSKIIPPYKLTHQNHPCCLWARKSSGNFNWLTAHTRALLAEYKKRYAKTHKSAEIFEWIKKNKSKLVFLEKKRTPFVQAMPEIYQTDDAVEAYRNYYIGEKYKFALWRKSQKPYWFISK